ncbi:beta-mannosidase-like [Haemaphysalis longicornis]
MCFWSALRLLRSRLPPVGEFPSILAHLGLVDQCLLQQRRIPYRRSSGLVKRQANFPVLVRERWWDLAIRVPCIVPGGIYTDLKRAGVIEEPYWGFNDMNYEWVAHENWTFYRDFKVPANLLRYNEVILVAHGIDTVCNVTLNGVALLEARNMFVRYEASVKSSLHRGRNRIRVQCESPVTYARRMHERQQAEYPVYPLCPSPAQGGQCHVNFIRKMPCSFGWDWAPSFPSTGIWKSIEIEAYDEVVIRDVTVTTTPQRRPRGGQKWIIELTVFYKRSTRAPRNGTIRTIKVEPWWPTGYGSQNLYCLNVTLYGKKESSQKTAMFGFRTVRINEDEIENTNGGTEFYFEINGVPIYAKGSNWVPADIFPERATSDYVEDLLISAKDANMNMLRVWGGGVYETDDFYDKADELGILIWQDMMFSTSLYPADSAFLQSVATEVEQQVRRLQRHPSLVVWVGNNENEEAMAYVWWDGVSDRMEQYVDDYKKLYVGTVKEVIDKEDTSRPFLPSTPSSGRLTARQGWISHDPNSHLSGDKHHYDYVANAWVPSSYPGARFVSEFGLQSYPSRETMKRVAAARMLTFPLSTFLDHRQHQMQGAEHVVSGIGLHFSLMLKGEPALTNKQKAYDVFAFLSQIVQAEGVRTGCEAFRRWRGHLLQAEGSGHNMGVLFWQLNDIWPAPSWSAIEYGGRWKMLQYFAKRFFSPVLVSPYVSDLSLRVFIINDHLRPLERAVLNLTIYKWSSFDPVYTKTLHLSVVSMIQKPDLK